MRITTKGRYALRAVLNLALDETKQPISIKKLSAIEEISPEFLEQLFFKLKKAGIISSTRGPGGGFTLLRKASEVTVKEIFDAAGEEILISPCTDPMKKLSQCTRVDKCLMNPIWQEVSDHFLNYFDNITLEGILEKSH